MSFRTRVRVKRWKAPRFDEWPLMKPTTLYSSTISSSCPVCGMSFVDAFGRPLVMGYVCNNIQCPTGLGMVRSSVSYTTGVIQ